MLKLFRKIRQELLEKGKVQQYSLYALGEILLVMIGILLALQVNNWNQERLNRQTEKTYLQSISKDLKDLLKIQEQAFLNRMDRKMEGLKMAKAYNHGELTVKDTMAFLYKVSYGAVFSGGYHIINTSTYQELISTGNIRIIKDPSLKNKIVRFYDNRQLVADRINILKSDFVRYVNSLRPFNRNEPNNLISPTDQQQMMAAFKTQEFQRLIDLEMSYAYSVKSFLEDIKKSGLEIIKLIDEKYK